ncbi:sporulation initiation inhibitor protein Soj [Treponema primitia ZAS-2]|uniref:Sporulation initiation inhibitor protein Soj n=1 Tax=Treponema primitia (strain ATCC BAA-887 / DSM 12427 / ZAS-2) TaxID=545694 RepID=F5YQI1_TREPZ|nr:ParA family protein [Treponema primitia]AEF85748.1 sporulation initiation inhibitor protein Soj [Treponema primitia ZAS-2]
MGKTYVFVNQKGGVGKTTSAISLGAYLAEAGKSVLLVDFDSQANLSNGIGAGHGKPGVYELISGTATLEQVIRSTEIPTLQVIPASIDLSGAAVELVEEEGRDFFLKNALAPIRDRYDYILIDCPPSLGVLTLNGMVAADAALIPMQCEYFAMEGLALLLQTIKRIQKKLNPSLEVGGLFFTMYDSRTRLAQEVVTQVSAYFKQKVFTTIVPRNVRLSEAPSYGQPISRYDPNCSGAKAYKSLAGEVIRRGA